MLEILTRAICFVAIIILGNILRRVNFFKEEDFKILSKILLRITLPAAIVTSFVGKKIEISMLTLALIGITGGALHMTIGFLVNRKANKERQEFEIVNAGYNIGAFTMPFAQGFLGPIGVITTSLFDIGNAFVCLGGSLGVANIIKSGEKFSVKKIIKTMLKSVALDTYLIMTLVSLLQISIPGPVVTLAEVIGNANAFVAMLMIGIGFKLSGDKGQLGYIARVLLTRYLIAAVLAAGCFYLLPFSLEVRKALIIVAFSPIPSSAPAYAAELKNDVGLASALNSISIICSLVFIVSILMVS
jgi:predicted permease